jgi:hypothetical protein
VLLTAVSALALVLALIAMDDRVREQIALRLTSQPTVELTRASARVRNLTAVVTEAAKRQTLEHAPLVIFGLAGTVLVIFMLRT